MRLSGILAVYDVVLLTPHVNRVPTGKLRAAL
jgi:hypothetical protein